MTGDDRLRPPEQSGHFGLREPNGLAVGTDVETQTGVVFVDDEVAPRHGGGSGVGGTFWTARHGRDAD